MGSSFRGKNNKKGVNIIDFILKVIALFKRDINKLLINI